MASRTEKEMAALLAKFNEQIGPLDKWSEPAMEKLNDWLADTSIELETEWVKRDGGSDSDT
jgi:hypothetical protein